MLQLWEKENYNWQILLVILFFGGGCKDTTPQNSEEETAYLADYEAPDHTWGFMDTTGILVIDAIYDDIGPFSEGLAAVCYMGKWGYIDRKGQVVIPPQFKSAWAFHDNRARVQPFDLPRQFIGRNGHALQSDEWLPEDDFTDGLARVSAGNQFGYVDTAGQLVIPAIYARAWNFNKGLARIEHLEKQGVINTSGDIVIPPAFDQIRIENDAGLILCHQDENAIVFNLIGKELFHLPKTKLVAADGHLLAVRKAELMYFVEIKSRQLLHNQSYKNLIYLGHQRWAVQDKDGYFLADHTGDILTPTSFSQINRFSDAFASVAKNDVWNYIDISGQVLTEESFVLAWDYREGFARAAFEDGIAFINRQQELAFYPPEGALDMRDFSEGLAPVQVRR